MGLLEVGKYYYYGKFLKKYKCIEVGEQQSWFKEYKGIKFQFYNHDMYTTKSSDTQTLENGLKVKLKKGMWVIGLGEIVETGNLRNSKN